MTAEQVDDAIASAHSIWASAIEVLVATDDPRDHEAAECLRRLSQEPPTVNSETDVLAWSSPFDLAVRRLLQIVGHDFAIEIQWSFIDVLIMHHRGRPTGTQMTT